VAERITDYCKSQNIPLDRTRIELHRSEAYLPTATLPPLDMVLIDGCHGFPAPFIDWYYSSLALKIGGMLLVDDIQLRTGAVLVDYLKGDPDWEFVADLGKTAAFRKLRHVGYVKEWSVHPWTRDWKPG
jgi:hypothetical protein